MMDITRGKAAGLAVHAVTAGLVIVLAAGAAAETLMLSTLAECGSDAHRAAERFAARVGDATDRRIVIQVRPASELGDWPEVHEGVAYGSVPLALQPLSTRVDGRLAINWFPYAVQDYTSAREAFAEGGFIFEAVDAMLEGGPVEILAPYAIGMGGAGFMKAVPEPRNPDAEQG